VFGIGGQEFMIIGLLLLIVFGPARVGQMAREVGRFAYGARKSVEEIKAELTAADPPNPGREKGRRGRQDEKPAEKEKPQRAAEG
jgi:sec-independent protein translocase protein TatB